MFVFDEWYLTYLDGVVKKEYTGRCSSVREGIQFLRYVLTNDKLVQQATQLSFVNPLSSQINNQIIPCK